jgi:rhamnosyltransferase subunit B
VPMLVTPYAHDQPDNAARVTRLGVARTLARSRYTVRRATEELAALLDSPAYARQAAAAGVRVQGERGVAAACDEIERQLR